MVNTDIFHHFSGCETTMLIIPPNNDHRCPQGYEEDTVQVFEERLKEFLAEDFRKFSVEVEKGAISGSKIWGDISCYLPNWISPQIELLNGSNLGVIHCKGIQ